MEKFREALKHSDTVFIVLTGVGDIKIKHWEWTCGDDCCYESGSDLYVNDCLLGDISDGYQYTILSMMDFFFRIQGCQH